MSFLDKVKDKGFGAILGTIFSLISGLAKALGEDEATVYKRVGEYCLQKAKDSTDPLLVEILADYDAPPPITPDESD